MIEIPTYFAPTAANFPSLRAHFVARNCSAAAAAINWTDPERGLAFTDAGLVGLNDGKYVRLPATLTAKAITGPAIDVAGKYPLLLIQQKTGTAIQELSFGEAAAAATFYMQSKHNGTQDASFGTSVYTYTSDDITDADTGTDAPTAIVMALTGSNTAERWFCSGTGTATQRTMTLFGTPATTGAMDNLINISGSATANNSNWGLIALFALSEPPDSALLKDIVRKAYSNPGIIPNSLYGLA